MGRAARLGVAFLVPLLPVMALVHRHQEPRNSALAAELAPPPATTETKAASVPTAAKGPPCNEVVPKVKRIVMDNAKAKPARKAAAQYAEG